MNEFDSFNAFEPQEKMEIAEDRLLAEQMPIAADVIPEQSDLPFLSLRKEANIQGGALLIYHVILNAVVFFVVFIAAIFKSLQKLFESEIDVQTIVDTATQAAGWGYLAAVGVGLLVLVLWKTPGYIRNTICQKGKPMRLGTFLVLLSMMMAPQMVAQIGNLGLLGLLELLGMDGTALEEMAAVDTDSLSMFLYVGIAAPITEELLFRGLVLRSIEPYNKKLAILASALLFGLYHGNPVQTPYAILVGLVLGYVALEYHVIWAIALHIFNNLCFAMLLPKALEFLPLAVIDLVMWVIIIGFFLAAVLILLAKWDEVRLYWKSETVYPRQRRAFFGSPTVIILMVICLLNLAATTLLLFLQ